MKNKVKLIVTLTLMIIFTSLCNVGADEAKSVDIMFLHDTHSHLNPFATVEDGE